MRKAIIFSAIFLGITSIVSQLIIIRETNVSFFGNEFFIGWTLFSWLFWVGIGSLLLNKIINDKNIARTLALCHILISVFFCLEIYLIRCSRIFLSSQTGQVPNLIPCLLYGFIILAPLCLILGLQFAIISRLWKLNQQKSETSKIIGNAYLLETIGFIVGGLIFNYFLIFINEFKVVPIIAWLNLLIGIFFLFCIRKNYLWKLISFVLIILFAGIFIYSAKINIQTSNFLFPHQKLLESKNSIYGNIAVTKLENQYNFYESGLFLGTDKQEISNEYIHIPLLYSPTSKNILLIGGGLNGILKEILKHQPEKVYYLELDPTLIEITKKYLPDDLLADLNDKRVKIINADARYFLKNTSENFDVIIINLPNPSTVLINRFYTEEFIKEAENHLSEKGILATRFLLSANYFGPEAENLDASLHKTLKNNFNSVLALPEDQHLFIASQNQLDYNPEPLIREYRERKIKNNFVNEEYIEYRLTNDRVNLLNNLLAKNKTAKINRDQLPISYYYNFTFWISSFYPKLAKIFRILGKLDFRWLIYASGLILILMLIFKRKIQQNAIIPSLMAIAGFSLMAMEMIIILGFQVFYGYIYYKIVLIITFLMAGMAIGTWLANKKLEQKTIKSIIKIHILIIIFSLILLFGFYFLFKISPKPSIFIEMIFLIAGGIIGTIVGFEFPIVNKFYLENIRLRPQGFGRQEKKVGTIYGADLFGSCLGASLISIFLLPIFGIYQTLVVLGILNILVIIPLYFTSSSSKT